MSGHQRFERQMLGTVLGSDLQFSDHGKPKALLWDGKKLGGKCALACAMGNIQ
ncbi:hypothetical protein [Chryseobacterium sp. VD8]|uniref:hypothetical protein n=1 Tax=Chryseobacterium sp. VD8 TaxID=3081254 RepID=UPI0012FEAF9D